MNAWPRQTLIIMTVGGGFAGAVGAVQLLIDSSSQATASLALAVLVLLLYFYVMAAGLVFAQSPRRTRPLTVSLILQVPWISCPLLLYKFGAGGAAFINATYSGSTGGWALNFDTFFGSRASLATLQQNPFTVGVNLWALAMLLLLWRSAGSAAVMHPAGSSMESA